MEGGIMRIWKFVVRPSFLFSKLNVFSLFQKRQISNSASLKAEQRIKIYTKGGDKGTSSLFNGERKPKDDQYFSALGSTDELNAHLGVAIEFSKSIDKGVTEQLEKIQSVLLDLGSAIATPKTTSNEAQLRRTKFDETLVIELEQWIDRMDDQLPPLRNFILPGGSRASAFLHVARTVCRRAEREVVPLVDQNLVDREVQIYLNRLSDYLFVAARYIVMKEGAKEIIYKKPKSSKLTES